MPIRRAAAVLVADDGADGRSLPWPLRSSLEATVRALLEPGDRPPIDFSKPIGEPAPVSRDSVSRRVFKNPLSLFIGGVTAVIMELAEPRVHTDVCEASCNRVCTTMH